MKWEDLESQLTSLSEDRKLELERTAKLINLIEARRHELGLTQKQLGERSGLKQSYITRVESGTTIPRIDTLLRLADALELDVTLIPRDHLSMNQEEAASLAASL